jgi:hypothetical protein
LSEYQYYEFLAIDRPLSAEDMAYVGTLSRRVQPTPAHAVFTYSYGDFPGDPLALLAKYYDARLRSVLAPYASSAALQRRLREKKLAE